MSPPRHRQSRPNRSLEQAESGKREHLDFSDVSQQVREAVETLVERKNLLKGTLLDCFEGSFRGLVEADLREALMFILVARLYEQRISACEVRDTLKEMLAVLDESEISREGPLARHLAGARELERRLDEVADWTEQTAVELDPEQSWVGISPEEFLFGAN
jgi:hypothetical protein